MSSKPSTPIKEQLIEENLKRAFADKANEAVPEELMALLDRLKAQDEENGAS